MSPSGLDLPLPTALRGPEPFRFVERPELWGALEEAWGASMDGASQLVLIAGEAGAGKTRLVTEFSRRRHAEGAVVLHGGCSEPPAAPYQPFAEAVDHLLASLDAGGRADLVGGAAHQLGRLVPRLTGESSSPASTDPDTERYRLFAAVTGALGAVADVAPLLIVLEDLHWATRPTLRLLEHLVRGSSPTRTCVLATFRSTPADMGEAFRSALPALRRSPGASRVVLGGFDRDGIRSFVEAAAGHPLHLGLERLIEILAVQTEGNPFLLEELWHHLVETGKLVRPQGPWRLARAIDDIGSPEGVREVVAARLGHLPAESREVMAVAAVLGTTFDLAVLVAAAGGQAREVLDALQPALDAGLIEEAGPGSCRFHHALVRRSVYDSLGLADRRVRHRAVALAYEEVRGDLAVGELAHHLAAAVPVTEAATAVTVARRAAEAATRAVAYDDAARHLDAVLPLTAGDADRCGLLLEAAESHMRAGDVATALDYCAQASELAGRLGEPALVVAAALAYDEASWRAARYGAAAEERLRRALPLSGDQVTRVRLRAALARALAFSGRGDEAAGLADEVLAEARALGDPATLRMAFTAVEFAPWTPATLDRQMAAAREFVALSQAEEDLEWEVWALAKLLYGFIFRGDLDEARMVAGRYHEAVRRLGQPLFRALDLQASVLLAVGEGRLSEAERLADQADHLTRFLSGSDMAGAYGVQLFGIRRLQGRLEEARATVEAVVRLGEVAATWRPALAVLRAELGQVEEAAADLRHLVAGGLRAVPRDSLWWGALSYLADACLAVGDHASAAVVYDELLACRGLVVQMGNFLAAYGAADRYLGMLASLLGQAAAAEEHFEAALSLDRRARMPVWVAQTQLAYGRFLATRERPADLARARNLAKAAQETARRLGLPVVAGQAAAVLASIPAAAVAPPAVATGRGEALTGREIAVLRLVVEGRSNREIAQRLHISPHTAANHVRAILVKTGCSNRTEAAAWALRHDVGG